MLIHSAISNVVQVQAPVSEVASLILRKLDEAAANAAPALEWSFRQRADWISYDAPEVAILESCYSAYTRSMLLELEEAESKRFCNLTQEQTLVHDMKKLVRYRADTPLRQTGVRRDVRPAWARPVAEARGKR